jgi:hypothetical protein
MENKKQTAVEWLAEQIREYDFSPRDNTYVIEIPSWIWTEKFEQALEMEKQQIIEAFNLGQQKEAKQEFWTKGGQYYNETYE